MNKHEKKLREQDEQIIAAVLSFRATHPRVQVRVNIGGWFENETDIRGRQYLGAACAVGAGLLYKGVKRVDLLRGDADTPQQVFAKLYGVTTLYAAGVSDGFENSIGVTEGWDSRTMDALQDRVFESDEDEADYLRGWAVGAAISAEVDPYGDNASPLGDDDDDDDYEERE